MTQLEALKHLSGGESTRFDASNLGSNVHAYADRSARGADAPISEAVSPFAVQFEQFRQDFNPTFLHTEATVFNREHQYAGTLDAIVEIDGVTYVMDYKTGKRVYPEVALQLSAYANAEFIGGPEGTEQPLPRCHRGLVLHIRPDHYELRPVVIGTGVFDAFLAALDVVRWSTVTSTYVIGRPLNETSNRGQQGLPLSV